LNLLSANRSRESTPRLSLHQMLLFHHIPALARRSDYWISSVQDDHLGVTTGFSLFAVFAFGVLMVNVFRFNDRPDDYVHKFRLSTLLFFFLLGLGFIQHDPSEVNQVPSSLAVLWFAYS
jgi:hypothetical protein